MIATRRIKQFGIKIVENDIICPLEECGRPFCNAQGLFQHLKRHVEKGEAKLENTPEGERYIPTGIPIPPDPSFERRKMWRINTKNKRKDIVKSVQNKSQADDTFPAALGLISSAAAIIKVATLLNQGVSSDWIIKTLDAAAMFGTEKAR